MRCRRYPMIRSSTAPSAGSRSSSDSCPPPASGLKGQGWYETDFKSDNQRNLHGEKEPSKKDDKSSSKKTDEASKTSSKPSPDSKSKSTA